MPRPTSYKPEYDEQARKLCLLGATNEELAEFFDVEKTSIKRWMKKHPSFAEAVRLGKASADANVADSLYRQAVGYYGEDGEWVKPNHVACIFWLKNRRSRQWRDKHEVDQKTEIKISKVDYSALPEPHQSTPIQSEFHRN